MGRRKIEIEPITNERNRSVTFLKRKNGLFKKAYELGVLCSVDIAVIVFEERPGHAVKMHQYCSGNVHNVIQRHLRFEGVRECRGPHDYNDKLAEADDDDEGPTDDESPGLSSSRAVRARPAPSSTPSSLSLSRASISKPYARPDSHPSPSSKRSRLSLPRLDSDPLVSELTGGSGFRYASASAASSAPAALGSNYSTANTHAWASALAGAQQQQQQQQQQSMAPPARQPPFAQQYSAASQYALAGTGASAGPFDLSMPPQPMRSNTYPLLPRASESYPSQSMGSNGLDNVFDFDWPVHGQQSQVATSAPAAPTSHSYPPSARVKPPSTPDLSWLDFLSGSANAAAMQQQQQPHAASAQDLWDARAAAASREALSSASRAHSGAPTFLPSPRSVEDDAEWVARS